MPRFYFDLTEDGETVDDPDGVMIARVDMFGFEEAVMLAELLLAHVWRRHPDRSRLGVVVRDGQRNQVAIAKSERNPFS